MHTQDHLAPSGHAYPLEAACCREVIKITLDLCKVIPVSPLSAQSHFELPPMSYPLVFNIPITHYAVSYCIVLFNRGCEKKLHSMDVTHSAVIVMHCFWSLAHCFCISTWLKVQSSCLCMKWSLKGTESVVLWETTFALNNTCVKSWVSVCPWESPHSPAKAALDLNCINGSSALFLALNLSHSSCVDRS